MSTLERIIEAQKERHAQRDLVIGLVTDMWAEERREVISSSMMSCTPSERRDVLLSVISTLPEEEQFQIVGKLVAKLDAGTIVPSPPVRIQSGTTRSSLIQKRNTHRDLITEVLSTAGRPLGAGEIIKAVQELDPERPRASLDAEMQRMQKDKILAPHGRTSRGATYALVIGGTPTPLTE